MKKLFNNFTQGWKDKEEIHNSIVNIEKNDSHYYEKIYNIAKKVVKCSGDRRITYRAGIECFDLTHSLKEYYKKSNIIWDDLFHDIGNIRSIK